MEAPALHKLIDHRYADRGGWKGVRMIFRGHVPYEMKLNNIKEQYRVSRVTAMRWYSYFRAQEGLKGPLP